MKKVSITMIPILILLCLGAPALAQQLGPQSLAQLQESPVGSRVLQFLNAINEGNRKDEAFIQSLFSQALIDKRGAARLADMLADIHQNDAPLALYEANRKEATEYQLKLMSGDGKWLDATLYLDASAPYKVKGLAIDVTFSPSAVAAPIWPEVKAGKASSTLPPPVSEAELAQKAKKIAQSYVDMGWFSGVILLAKDGKPFYQEAFGYADEARKAPNTMDTKFRIGSINKDYTSVLILQQVQKGRLSLDDKLAQFGLGFPAAMAEKITIRHLLNHTAGFADIFVPEYLDNIRSYKDIDDILPLLRDQPLMYEPGTDQAYSNYGYIVLGAILEKTTGKRFGELLEDQILQPISVNHTHYDIAENIEGEAQSYRYTASGKKVDHTSQLEYPTPDGGMYATANDLLAFFQALFYSNTLLNDEMKALLVHDFEAGVSWQEVLADPLSGAGYAGGGPGVNAVVELFFHNDEIFIVLANTDKMVAEHISRRIRMAKAGRSAPKAQLPVENYLYQYLDSKGAAYLEKNMARLLQDGGYGEPSPDFLNRLGYNLMEEGALPDAIEVFKANIALFPQEANGYDSLGEAYLKSGDQKRALEYYRKALELDPELPSARQMAKELEE